MYICIFLSLSLYIYIYMIRIHHIDLICCPAARIEINAAIKLKSLATCSFLFVVFV